MPEMLRQQILSLCNRVEEVTDNGDWPTTEGPVVEGLISEIREALDAA